MLAASTQAMAEVEFTPRVFAGIVDYELKITNKGSARIISDLSSSSSRNSIGANLPLIGLGGTLSNNNYFIDVYFQTTKENTQSPQTESHQHRNLYFSNIGDRHFDREDAALAFGRSVNDNWTVSIGYKTGETNTTQQANSGSMGERNVSLSQSFKLDGIFLATSYALPINSGVLGFNAAIADLDAELNSSLIFRNGGRTTNSFLNKPTGSATGLAFGVNWNANINQHWQYTTSLDYYNYDFNLSERDFSGRNDLDTDVEESALSLKLALRYNF